MTTGASRFWVIYVEPSWRVGFLEERSRTL